MNYELMNIEHDVLSLISDNDGNLLDFNDFEDFNDYIGNLTGSNPGIEGDTTEEYALDIILSKQPENIVRNILIHLLSLYKPQSNIEEKSFYHLRNALEKSDYGLYRAFKAISTSSTIIKSETNSLLTSLEQINSSNSQKKE